MFCASFRKKQFRIFILQPTEPSFKLDSNHLASDIWQQCVASCKKKQRRIFLVTNATSRAFKLDSNHLSSDIWQRNVMQVARKSNIAYLVFQMQPVEPSNLTATIRPLMFDNAMCCKLQEKATSHFSCYQCNQLSLQTWQQLSACCWYCTSPQPWRSQLVWSRSYVEFLKDHHAISFREAPTSQSFLLSLCLSLCVSLSLACPLLSNDV